MAIAYLSNSFPEATEPYVWEEISELRRRKQRVLPCSIKRPCSEANTEAALHALYVFPLSPKLCLAASWVCVQRWEKIAEFLVRAVAGREPVQRRVRTVIHTWLGAYLAAMLRDRGIKHIHVHHGYFSSWIGMVAAKILGAGFSMTLHGSDLLVRADYLDIKLKHCKFCVTISEFNRGYILRNYPEVDVHKILVHRVGIDVPAWRSTLRLPSRNGIEILSVGRLHAIKNHQFLILACRILKSSDMKFRCRIAGDGDERLSLQQLISALGLEQEVELLGHVPREQLPALYARADVVVLTSRSEGVPVALMEAMATGALVLAPDITGIPELIANGKSGFLYRHNSMDDFLQKLRFALRSRDSLDGIRRAGRSRVERAFSSSQNVRDFAASFLQRINAAGSQGLVLAERDADENPILQQIQLPV
jgi:glycosyltransferase involved in cell wall biosynthesis